MGCRSVESERQPENRRSVFEDAVITVLQITHLVFSADLLSIWATNVSEISNFFSRDPRYKSWHPRSQDETETVSLEKLFAQSMIRITHRHVRFGQIARIGLLHTQRFIHCTTAKLFIELCAFFRFHWSLQLTLSRSTARLWMSSRAQLNWERFFTTETFQC